MANTMRHTLLASLVLSTFAFQSAHAQTLLGKPKPQQVTLSAASSAAVAKAGAGLTLWADVTPNPTMHVYAEGATEFTPVSIVLTPNPAVAVGRATYPKPELASSPGSTEGVPAYNRTFRIAVPVTIVKTATAGAALVIGGGVTYQACDNRLCYPVNVAPVTWNVTVQ